MLKFFLNSRNTSHLRDLALEYGESTNAIRLELNHLEKAQLLLSVKQGNKKVFQANTMHPFYGIIHQLLMKHTGIDQIIDNVVRNLRGVQSAYVTGSFAKGNDNPVVDLLLLGKDIEINYLIHTITKAEILIHRKIRYTLIHPDEAEKYLSMHPEAFLLWQENEIQL